MRPARQPLSSTLRDKFRRPWPKIHPCRFSERIRKSLTELCVTANPFISPFLPESGPREITVDSAYLLSVRSGHLVDFDEADATEGKPLRASGGSVAKFTAAKVFAEPVGSGVF